MTNEEAAVQAKDGDRRALFDLWEAVKPFCMKAAWNTYNRFGAAKCASRGVVLEDLQQETYVAFTDALRGFSAASGYKFITYLSLPLRNAFARLLGFKESGKGKPDPLDSAARFDEPIDADSTVTLSDVTPDPDAEQALEDAEETLFIRALHTALEDAMREACTPEQTDVLHAIYYRGKNRREAGDDLGITRERVRQIESKALNQLRRPHVARHLREFDRYDEVAYSISTSFETWKNCGSNPERAVERIEFEWPKQQR